MRNPPLLFLMAAGLLLSVPDADAHPGGLNGEGCHNNRKTGDYHCHRGGGGSSSRSSASNLSSSFAPSRASSSSSSRSSGGGAVYYPNCAAARAGGAAPVRAGDPGYSSRLDRDGDGVGCER